MEARERERAKEMETPDPDPFLLLGPIPTPPLSESLEQATPTGETARVATMKKLDGYQTARLPESTKVRVPMTSRLGTDQSRSQWC